MSTRTEEIKAMLMGEWYSVSFKDMAKEVANSQEDIKILFSLNKDTDHRIAWRSAYMLDLVNDVNIQALDEYLEFIMSEVPELTSQSIKRHYLRILSHHDLSEIAEGQLVDCCFEWLQTQETSIAVKAHCMQILFDLTKPYPELIPELSSVLENLLPFASKGEKNRAKKILKELNTR